MVGLSAYAGFQSLTDGINATTNGGRLVFHIMGALAEFERDLIRERTKAGMKAAQKRGKHVGRPKSIFKWTGTTYARVIRCGKDPSRSSRIVRCLSKYDWTESEGKNEYEDHRQK
jgi:DNA invertase Pin-like site-specific DNA recombinase